MFGLHPNAEIGYLTSTGEKLFSTILTVQGGSGGGEGGSENELHDKIRYYIDNLPETFEMIILMEKAKLKTPFQVVCL